MYLKKISLLFIIMIAFFSAPFAQENPTIDRLEKIAFMEQKANYQKLKGPQEHIGENYDLKYHRFYWEINPAIIFIEGYVTSLFEVKEEMAEISFQLNDNMTVDSVIFRGEPVSHAFSTSTKFTIDLGTTLNQGEMDSVTVYYRGEPDSGSGFGSFVNSTHQGTPVLWTLSEPYGAKSWWPCKNHLSDKIDSIDVYVRTSTEYKTASNGLLVEVIEDGDEHIYHWKHQYPIPAYLIAIAVTNYATYVDDYPLGNGDTMDILNYVFPEDLEYAQQKTPNTVEAMHLYDSLFIQYPYAEEKYGHAQFGWGGGMEHTTMSFMGSFDHGLIAHELAHMWFGDMITLGTWHDIWLNEGFATYLTGLTYEHMFNGIYWETWKTNTITHVTSQPGGSVYVEDTTSVSRIFDSRLSYSKGATLLHMLRWIMGEDAFYQSIKNYLNDPELAFDYAVNEDLKQHLEAAHGEDLTWFFDDWYYGEGYPSYTLNVDALEDGKAKIIIHQTQSHSSVDFFEMPVPVKLIGSNRDTTVRLDHTYDGEEFIVDVGFNVQNAEFDPELWLVSKDDTVIMSTPERQLNHKITIAPNPTTGLFNLEYQGTQALSIALYTANNTKLRTYSMSKADNVLSINLHNYEAGIYFLKIQTEKASLIRKIVKR
ncbi:MAG: T9SS type A sorting domain-containing protein [Bacteroidales bacterium]|nr:T9SS type A sorting domain-containing protein [Bacteroidales bacterium]